MTDDGASRSWTVRDVLRWTEGWFSQAELPMPRLDAAVVYIPRHTFGAVGLPAESGEVCVRVDGEKLVMVEPVGPAQRELGDGGRRSKSRARSGAVRAVTVAKKPLRQVPGVLQR